MGLTEVVGDECDHQSFASCPSRYHDLPGPLSEVPPPSSGPGNFRMY
jgi:hypothetical protein